MYCKVLLRVLNRLQYVLNTGHQFFVVQYRTSCRKHSQRLNLGIDWSVR